MWPQILWRRLHQRGLRDLVSAPFLSGVLSERMSLERPEAGNDVIGVLPIGRCRHCAQHAPRLLVSGRGLTVQNFDMTED